MAVKDTGRKFLLSSPLMGRSDCRRFHEGGVLNPKCSGPGGVVLQRFDLVKGQAGRLGYLTWR